MQCVVWIVYNFSKKLIVTLLQQLANFREVGWAEAASLTAAQKRIYSLAVCRSNKTAPRGRRICQPGHDDNAEDGVQASRRQPVMPQYTEHVQRLRAATDNLANMIRRRQVTCDGHSKNFKRVLARDVGQCFNCR